ncbi:hypothetical protein Tco_1213174 [Tanacetum coccineum]
MEVALKKRRVVLSDSEDEDIEKDEAKGYMNPKDGTTTGDMDIIPQGLEAAQTLTETLSQIKSKKQTNKAKERRRLDAEDVSTVNFKEEVNTTSEVLLVSTVDVNISTASRTVTYSRRSAEKRLVKDKGKAIMTEPKLEKKSKRELEEERLSLVEAYRLQEQIDDEQRAQIARDEEIARQWEAEEQQRAIDKEKSTKIDWNDPSNFNHTEHVLPEQVKKKEQDKSTQVEKEVAKKHGVKRKKLIPRKSTKGSNKKQNLEEDAEREGLKDYLDVVPREDVAIDVESLSTKYPIVDWKTYIVSEKFMYYQVFRGDESSKNYKILSEMLEDFDRQDVEDLYIIVKDRFASSRPEGYDLMLWGDLHTLFEPNAEDEI